MVFTHPDHILGKGGRIIRNISIHVSLRYINNCAAIISNKILNECQPIHIFIVIMSRLIRYDIQNNKLIHPDLNLNAPVHFQLENH